LFSTTISDPHHHHVFPIFLEWRRTSKDRKDAVRIPRLKREIEQTDRGDQEKNWKLFSITHLSSKPSPTHTTYPTSNKKGSDDANAPSGVRDANQKQESCTLGCISL